MPHKGPHISIASDVVVHRILRIDLSEFVTWPQAVRRLAIEIAEELFLVVCNPFVDPEEVRNSVNARYEREVFALAHHYATTLSEGLTLFWSAHEAEVAFRDELVRRLGAVLPADAILTRPSALVACATDATDLRMELPLLVVEPANESEVSELVRLANEMKFALVPSGGASGMTGGAIPVRKRSVVVCLARLTGRLPVNVATRSVRFEAGVITQDAVQEVARQGWLLTLDPASKAASTIGGNVAENSGGPCAFEYGTTLDNLLAWRMVTPTGEIIDVVRAAHPRHKIMPDEVARFEVRDPSGGVRKVVELRGDEIRLPGLGKDVTDKALGGLPGVQKEGVDGIIVDATFVVHARPAFSRVMVLEFFGSSMHEAAVVIGQIVQLRDQIRRSGDYARLSALEEFNAKYVQAIDYKTKSPRHEASPISVIILQVDGDDTALLERCVSDIAAIVQGRESVALLVARDAVEAEHFWEDRHRLSAIARRTSGFKLNEDVVIPMARIPDFALFLESLNRQCAAAAYTRALQAVGRLRGVPFQCPELNREFVFASRLAAVPDAGAASESPSVENVGEVPTDDAIEARGLAFLESLGRDYPALEQEELAAIAARFRASRVMVASHMHAGDGNCHVNIPVNSNDLEMLEQAEEVAARVMTEAQRMGGAVSGEHGIGITKLPFLGQDKMDAIRAFKEQVDPRDVCNPSKLTQRELPVRPYTFSFNRLIADIRESGLPDTERLIRLLSTVQVCTRCGKCKQVCPMLYPERSLQYHPRNKNMMLGSLIEAVYYSQITTGKPHPRILGELRCIVEHCTGCGRCTAVCPVKIPSAEVGMELRAFLEDGGAGGHPIKSRVLTWLAKKPALRVPQAAKAASLGQRVQNSFLNFMPLQLRRRLQSPIFSSKGPAPGYTNLYEALHLDRGGIFVPEEFAGSGAFSGTQERQSVLYFPGCGGSLFSRGIGLGVLALLLDRGIGVIMPETHLCCGYPLLAAGADKAFEENMAHNREELAQVIDRAARSGFPVSRIITACGSCREGIERHGLTGLLAGREEQAGQPLLMDAVQFLAQCRELEGASGPLCPPLEPGENRSALYHVSCHTEWGGVHKVHGVRMQVEALEALSGGTLRTNHGCCGESGMGAITSPDIFNILRDRKIGRLEEALGLEGADGPILVGCPSCRLGIARCLIRMKQRRTVLHAAEWLARLCFEPRWGAKWQKIFCARVGRRSAEGGVRFVRMS